MALTFKHTRYATYCASFSQAVVVNLAPLFFVIFRDEYGLSFEQLGRLILINFLTQLFADFVTLKYADKLGYRLTILLALIFFASGLVLLGVLPAAMADKYTALVIATLVYSFGGGICEVVNSPIVDSLPGEEKEAAMSMTHSFYCWGQTAVIALTTLALKVFGLQAWQAIAIGWAFFPALSCFLFAKVPLGDVVPEDKQMGLGELFKSRGFLIAMLLMISAGASELSISQWSSYFAQRGLHVPKMVGDLFGPCMFAILMAIGRTIFGIYGSRIPLRGALLGCGILGVVGYLLTVLSPWAWLSLAGCAVCGFAVSLMWPGSLSLTAVRYPLGGTLMFGVLAVCGDIGCSTGPWLTGLVADHYDDLKYGLLFASLFPLLMVTGAVLLARTPMDKQAQ